MKQLTNPVMHGGVMLVDGGTNMSARWTNNSFDNVHQAEFQPLPASVKGKQNIRSPAPPEQTKKAIPVPLNSDAMAVLHEQTGIHDTLVFTNASGGLMRWIDFGQWSKSLEKAGIKDFRWHDLRHTWASWHIQGGTPLHVLQELAGWESPAMVRRYEHDALRAKSQSQKQNLGG